MYQPTGLVVFGWDEALAERRQEFGRKAVGREGIRSTLAPGQPIVTSCARPLREAPRARRGQDRSRPFRVFRRFGHADLAGEATCACGADLEPDHDLECPWMAGCQGPRGGDPVPPGVDGPLPPQRGARACARHRVGGAVGAQPQPPSPAGPYRTARLGNRPRVRPPRGVEVLVLQAVDPLRPNRAEVGMKIWLVGNDAGEKLSILTAVISRLDRNAPEYDEDIATLTSVTSRLALPPLVVAPAVLSLALMDTPLLSKPAAEEAARQPTTFCLWIDRPLRALKCLQEDKPITRGDIQCSFLLQPFDECRRLGMGQKLVSALTGLPVVWPIAPCRSASFCWLIWAVTPGTWTLSAA
ncbi:hypothetical protein QBC34DRAFT_469916 [Podospora aff. communis PSN243]|uniref:N-acetyltransferase domain-containing protein n=1 Tax=Podospora aff. communis PSN243 TaxID=3040156 RepID=A0AAV9GFR2_9PEZI|nr:hypothetical protein QBC34DRAFT_469916 [Podospora aff. communis PSN243]